MSKGNWPNGWDLSHPNWTGSTPNAMKHPVRKREREPSVLAQVLLGILAATTFMLGMYAL